MKILVLCSGNSCRSQMAHGFLESFDNLLIVRSAGAKVSGEINEKAVIVMQEVGIDISNHTSDPVEKYQDEEWDYVMTVCTGANKACPAFFGKVKHRLHMGFDDPSHLTGTEDYIMSEFRRVRDEIKEGFYKFYTEQIIPQLSPDEIYRQMLELYIMLLPPPFQKKEVFNRFKKIKEVRNKK
jgi:arsenate reductase